MDIEIRKCKEKDIDVLKRTIPRPEFHDKRFESQEKGDSEYLVAWLDDIPVGHLNLILVGSGEEYVKERLGFLPELNAIGTYPDEMRSKGIGRKLIEEAEMICKSLGYKKVGLAVDTSNKRARELYERLGYKDAGIGEFDSIWYEQQDDGSKLEIVDHCIYMLKDL
ncbi:MAG: GNAT family N-acetyltransferase [Candidatus Nomurabacteria bacterium]|nr:MAG: GNAT family N-acetyltransferase [Candidatus Nomurabacteria bacterium]HRV76202.1 GNAT family N-acetyltransferase [Candidatus Saccharimonadales bacterium]